MDRRTLLAVVLSVAIYYAWLAIRGPQLQQGAVEGGTDGPAEVVEAAPEPAVAPPPTPPTAPIASDLPEEQVSFELCQATGTLSTTRGVSSLVLKEHEGPYNVQPLYTWIWGKLTGSVEGGWSPWGDEPGAAEILSDKARGLTVGSGPGPGASAPAQMAVVSNTPSELVLRGRTAEGLEVTQAMRPTTVGDQCLIDLSVTWKNAGGAAYSGPLWLGIHGVPSEAAGGMTARYQSQRQPTAVTDGDLHYGGPYGAGCVRAGTRLSDEERAFALEGPVSWFGLSDRYFGFYILPKDPDVGQAWLSRVGAGDEALDGTHLAIAANLAPGQEQTASFTTYVGPNDMNVLSNVHEDLGRVVDLGWFAFFGYPLLAMLRFFQAAVGNWGVAIIMLTFVVKLIFFPMTQRSFKSMQKMQQIQPELNKIREELKDNPQEMNRRVFEVMQENNVNPAAGCLPMFVQMPVWIALYNVLLTSVDLYHTEFLYLKDLTQPDPYLVLPITIMVLMFVQQRFTTPANMDPAQQQVMRLMPLFFGLLFFAFPSGLAVYVFVNMVLSNLQQWLIKRSMGSSEPGNPAGVAAT